MLKANDLSEIELRNNISLSSVIISVDLPDYISEHNELAEDIAGLLMYNNELMADDVDMNGLNCIEIVIGGEQIEESKQTMEVIKEIIINTIKKRFEEALENQEESGVQ